MHTIDQTALDVAFVRATKKHDNVTLDKAELEKIILDFFKIRSSENGNFKEHLESVLTSAGKTDLFNRSAYKSAAGFYFTIQKAAKNFGNEKISNFRVLSRKRNEAIIQVSAALAVRCTTANRRMIKLKDADVDLTNTMWRTSRRQEISEAVQKSIKRKARIAMNKFR